MVFATGFLGCNKIVFLQCIAEAGHFCSLRSLCLHANSTLQIQKRKVAEWKRVDCCRGGKQNGVAVVVSKLERRGVNFSRGR